MIETLWQYGVLSAVLVFGVKLGLAMGFAGLNKKQTFSIILGYGLGIILLTKICEPFMDIVYQIVYQYSSIVFILMAIVIFYTGFHTVRDWKKDHKNHATATCMAMIAPCPCCFGAVIGAIILMSPIVSVSSMTLGIYSSIVLMLLMAVFYILSEKIVKIIKKPFPIVLGNFMMFVGLYFIISAVILPNIGTAFSDEMQSITITSPWSLLTVLIFMLCIIFIGIFYQKRRELT